MINLITGIETIRERQPLSDHPPRPPHARDERTYGPRLESSLRRALKGEVRFDEGSRALHATDASNYRQVPIEVVIPRDAEDALAAIRACREFGAPVLSRGAGTSLAGQCCNVAVLIDFSKHMNRILDCTGSTFVVDGGMMRRSGSL